MNRCSHCNDPGYLSLVLTAAYSGLTLDDDIRACSEVDCAKDYLIPDAGQSLPAYHH